MGCTESQIQTNIRRNIITDKASVWFITGGPGSQKGKVIESLIRDYKFKYLSGHDILQFWKQRSSPDSLKIKKLIQQNKTFPSDLVARLVKQAVAYLGVRRYLIDDFPRNIDDVRQFDKIVTSKDITIQKMIYINASRQTMIKSGIQAKSDQKADKQQIQKLVTQLVDIYLKDTNVIIKEFEKKQMIYNIVADQGPSQSYRILKQKMESNGCYPPNPISVFFSHFDDQKYEGIYCDDLIMKYGLYFQSVGDLIEQAAFKKSAQAQFIKTCAKNKKQLPPDFVLALIKKKIEKHDYSGNYLISGYPRFISDAQQWDKAFGWETSIKGYLTFEIPDVQFKPILQKRLEKNNPSIKKQQIDKQFDLYQKNQKEVCDFYQQKNQLLKVDCGNDKKVFSDIDAFLAQKSFAPKKNIFPNSQMVFLSTLSGEGSEIIKTLKNHQIVEIDFAELVMKRMQTQNLYNQLIQNHIKVGRPLTGYIAVKILMDYLTNLKSTASKFVVKGFPNTAEELTVWEQQVGLSINLTHIIYFQTNKKFITQGVKSAKIMGDQNEIINLLQRHADLLEKKLISSDWKYTKVCQKDGPQVYNKIIENDLKKSGFLK